MKPIYHIILASLLLLLGLTSCNQNITINENSNVQIIENSIIYEANIRQFSQEGTFQAFAKELPRIKEMGVDVIWLMPIHPIGLEKRKGSLGSPYSIKDYKAVNPQYGTMEDFKNLVNTAHNLDMKVIIDWVANHTAWDNEWVSKHPEYYAKDSINNMFGPFDWTDVAQLDYKNEELRLAMIDALTFWIKETDIDGFRCDVAGMVPVDFWEKARVELDKIKPVFMLAEDETNKKLLTKAFNANYGWKFHHAMNHIAQGKSNATEIEKWFLSADTSYMVGRYPMLFTSNHDENSWNGTEYERMGDAVKTMALLSFVAPGMPLIYNGQEASLNKRLLFFEKDTINWSNLEMALFYKQLSLLKKSNSALANGSYGGKVAIIPTNKPDKIIAFSRRKSDNEVISIFNLSKDTVSYAINKHIDGAFTDFFSKHQTTITSQPVTLLPWQYTILTKD